MDIEWRTVQLFLDNDGVAEVEIDAENNKKVRCSCKGFMASGRCKHAKFVRHRMGTNNGLYSIEIPEEVPDEVALAAMGDASQFRDFILKYARVEVID